MIRQRAVRWSIAAVLVLMSCSSQAEDRADTVFKRVSPAVVTVLAFDEQGREEAQGSGVVIGAGRVATNCHVVREARSLKLASGNTQFTAKWLLTHPKRDLCLLSAEGLTTPELKVRALADIPVGEAVYAVGNPLGFGLSVSAGLVSAVVPIKGEQVILSSAPQSPGSSGGGLFDSEGRLLGLTTGILGTGQNLNVVLPAEWLADLNGSGIAPPADTKVPDPEPRWIEEALALHRGGDWARLEKHAQEWQADQPASALAAAYRAAALSGKARHKEAEAALRDSLRLDADNEYTWRLLARTLRTLGRKEDAQKALDRAQAVLPSAGATHSLRAEWLYEEQRYEEAAASVREAIRLEPGESFQWRTLGKIEDALGHAEAAARAYSTALRLAPSDVQLKQALAQVLVRQGKVEDARLALGQAGDRSQSEAETWLALGSGELTRKRYAAAEEAYKKASEIAPDLPQVWALLGIVMVETNRATEGIKFFDRTLAFSKPAPVAFVAETLTNRGVAQNLLGNKTVALADARRAIEADASFAPAHRLLGILRAETRDYRSAVAAFRKVVELGAAGADDWTSLGENLEKLGDKQPALEALQQAEKFDAKNIRVLQALAGYHGRNGDLQRALSYNERALAVDSSSAINWSNKGDTLLRLGRLEESTNTLKTAVSLDPQFAQAWINLGEAQLHSRQLGQAIQSLEKALALAPAAPEARLLLAQAYVDSQQSAKAREQAEMLLKRFPDWSPALGVVTLSYLLEGKGQSAANSYRRLLAKDPAAARSMRSRAITLGIKSARELPE